ncbi:CaiB/BaiF CoA transferase family protein [Variovorax sp. LjRoot178]|uniref:CaiB/BaiF CoA transferase family protein n=1 Tax=Variovorax sp. LjRoot178 TaxID=3342277 RepID=UPI003ECC7411
MTKSADVSRSGPLTGVKVLDLTSVVMGPFATQILASLGAEVTKIEPPEGDNMRHVGPMRNPGMGQIFLQANQGKRSVVLNLKQPEAREAVLRLAERCDVWISNVRPEALGRLGLDYGAVRERNPRIIYVSCCGFDQRGPYAGRPAYDDLIQGATCVPWLMQAYGSEALSYAPVTLADRVTGLHAVYAVTAALYARERTGEGQEIVVPMFEAMTQFVLGDHLAGLGFEPPIGEPGYARLLTVHRRPYRTRDGYLCVLIYNDKHWRSFFDAIGDHSAIAHDPRFTTHGARAANIGAMYDEVSRIIVQRGTAEWRSLLDAADIPNMPMNSPQDLLDDPHHAATGFIHAVDHPTEGRLRMLGSPTRWSGTTPAESMSHAPLLGEHSGAVLRELGYSTEQIDHMLSHCCPVK